MLPRPLWHPIASKARPLLAVFFILVPAVAHGQEIDGRSPLVGRAPLETCRGDIVRLCGDGAYGRRIVPCLMSHRDRLSLGCRRRLAELAPVRSGMFACAADARRLCPGTLPGGGRIVACLMRHRDAISGDCDRALDEAASIGR